MILGSDLYPNQNRYYSLNLFILFFCRRKTKKIFELNLKKRNISFVECILEKRAFNEVFRECLSTLELPSKDEIVKVMKESNLYRIESDETYRRRASTISGWINWILDLTR